jgi:hypothetical protein
MKRPRYLPMGTLGVILSFAAGGYAQNIESLRDVPFIATRTYTSQGNVKVQNIARASNGSTYIEEFSSRGTPEYITIKDVPHQRMVTLFIRQKQYATQVMDPSSFFQTFSVQEWFDLLRGPHSKSPGYSDLGTRSEAGMTLYGSRTIFQDLSTESWESADLGTTYRYRVTSLEGDVRMDFTLGDIRHEEPNAALFEIPEGYLPAKLPQRR